MLITRRELEIEQIVAEKAYAPEAVNYRGAEFRQVGPLRVSAVAELEGEDIRIRGRFWARIEASCDRCLRLTDLPIERDFDLTYRPISSIAREEEIEIPEAEMDIGFYHGDGLDLTDVLAEQMILAFPMKLVCKDDCRGLCPTCGTDRNEGECLCPEPRPVSPFAALRGD